MIFVRLLKRSPSKGSFFLLRKNHSSFYGKLIKSERGLRVMDEMKISSKFTRMLLSKLAKGVLHKKLGYNVDIQLNELNASISDEKAHVHMLNYEVLAGIYPMLRNHELDEWVKFCKWIEALPYSDIIIGRVWR